MIVNAPVGFSFTNLSGEEGRDRVGKPSGATTAAVNGTRRRFPGMVAGFSRRSWYAWQWIALRLKRNAWLHQLLMQWRFRRLPSVLVSRGTTKLVVEGFPRSANTFTVRMFHAANPEITPDQISHHSHSISNVKRAVRWGIPVVVVISNPIDAVASNMIFLDDTSDAMGCLLATKYIDFYGWVEENRGSVVVLRFEDVTNGGFGRACRLINDRFGTCFRTECDEAELARSALETIMLGSPNRENDSRIPLPSRVRSVTASALRSRIAANPAIRKALELYERLAETCLDEPSRRSS